MKVVSPSFEIITPIDGMDILKTIEVVGRTCYKSEDKITNDSCIEFVRKIIKSGHEAVIEHYNITVKLINDRGVSHEEVRHRIASYAQESTRYCNYSKDKFDGEVTYVDLAGSMRLDPKVSSISAEKFNGATPQIARSVLNNSTKTEICITMNLREWRHFFRLRCSPAAHPAMREIAVKLLKAFVMMIPVVFDDVYTEYLTSNAKKE